MDFPVSAEFAATANPEQLHADARGDSPEWPAAFVVREDGSWAYRINDVDQYVVTGEDGEPVACTRPRADVVIDADVVQAAIDNHVPVWPDPEPTIAELQAQIAELTALLGNS